MQKYGRGITVAPRMPVASRWPGGFEPGGDEPSVATAPQTVCADNLDDVATALTPHEDENTASMGRKPKRSNQG